MQTSIDPLERYTNKIRHFAKKPINYGVLTHQDAEAEDAELFVSVLGSQDSALKVTLYLLISRQSKTIVRAKFTSFGTYAARAICDMLCMILRTKKIDQLESIDYKALERFARDNPANEALPKDQRYLITFAINAIKKASCEYKNEPYDQGKIVCSCASATKELIQQSIREHELQSIKEIGDLTRAGRYCLSCTKEHGGFDEKEIYLDEILKLTKEEIAKEKELSSEDLSGDFETLGKDAQIAYINKIIDEHIRHFLVMDGGDMEILDLKQNGEDIDLYIRYLGACSGCASSATGTLFAIENILKEKLGGKVRVLPL